MLAVFLQVQPKMSVTNKQSAPSYCKNNFIDFSIEEGLLREVTM